ncbi:MAG: DUF1302 family protein [Desulfobacterales bacterium]
MHDAAYRLNGRTNYTEDVLDEYEDEIELREAHIMGRLTRNLDLKVGRQIVVWGKSDNIRITDVLNPLDLREPGLTDLDDLRLPLAMTKLDYYIGNWNMAGIIVHEIRFDKIPAWGSDFYPYADPLPGEDKPSDGIDNQEYGLSLKGTFSGWDISFFFADIFWDTPHARFIGPFLPVSVELAHARVQMLGTAFNAALGNWIVKFEAAYLDGLEWFNRPCEEYSRSDIMVGLEYYGFDQTVITLEIADRHIHKFDSALKQPPDSLRENRPETALRMSRTFMNETLELEYLLFVFGFDGKDGKFQRFTSSYDLTDYTEIKGGVLLYHSGDLPEYARIGDNDRIFAEIKYSF